MQVYNFQDFPFIEFGENPARKIRLLVSPQTTEEQRCSIFVPPFTPYGKYSGLIIKTKEHIEKEHDE
jgi:hypothetical protein